MRLNHSATDLILSVVDELETAPVKPDVGQEVKIEDEIVQLPQLTSKIITVDDSSSEDEEYQEMTKILIKPFCCLFPREFTWLASHPFSST